MHISWLKSERNAASAERTGILRQTSVQRPAVSLVIDHASVQAMLVPKAPQHGMSREGDETTESLSLDSCSKEGICRKMLRRNIGRCRHIGIRTGGKYRAPLILDCKGVAQDLVTREPSLNCCRQVGQRQSRKAEPIAVNCDSSNGT